MNEKFILKGNDYSPVEIKKWYEEEERYYDTFTGGRNAIDEHWRVFEVFNRKYAIDDHVLLTKDTKVLSFGCAEGSDTALLYKEFNFQIYGLDASEEQIKAFKKNYPDAEIVKATLEGTINFQPDFFDYIFCFGVLMHIPNVSFILKEFHRVLKKGGKIILREPLSGMHMNDESLKNMKLNGRGIPLDFMMDEFEKLDFEIIAINRSYYRPLMNIVRKFNTLSKFPGLLFQLDKFFCKMPGSKIFLNKFSPSTAYYIVQKRG